jgi:hypothetical protein
MVRVFGIGYDGAELCRVCPISGVVNAARRRRAAAASGERVIDILAK